MAAHPGIERYLTTSKSCGNTAAIFAIPAVDCAFEVIRANGHRAVFAQIDAVLLSEFVRIPEKSRISSPANKSNAHSRFDF
jgi:hypothetical protein